ncbi:enoyl-CoA hydratase/isomerase family protein [Nonomuraea sp. NPDC002799]
MPAEELGHQISPDGFQSIRLSRTGGVTTVSMLRDDGADLREKEGGPVVLFAQHKEIGQALHWLATDEQTRVVVLTGSAEVFVTPSKTRSVTLKDLPPEEDWGLMEGLRRTLLSIIDLEKPVIARVNGDAIGYGSSLVFACDFIVASQDALIGDHHLGMGDLPYGRSDFGFVPGDGGNIFVPLHMPPPVAKEYLMAARTWTTTEMAAAGMINYAVPRDELDATVRDLCERLIRRPFYALAWTKRILNQPVRQRFNDGYDAGIAYEMINIYQRRAQLHHG